MTRICLRKSESETFFPPVDGRLNSEMGWSIMRGLSVVRVRLLLKKGCPVKSDGGKYVLGCVLTPNPITLALLSALQSFGEHHVSHRSSPSPCQAQNRAVA